MIASRIGVVVAWACALLLGLALLLGEGAPRPHDRSLVPGLEPTAITALGWERPAGIAFRIERDPRSATGWRWTDPGADADAQAIEDLQAALRGGQWHREAPRAAGGAPSGQLTIETATTRTVIELGQLLGAEQRWLLIGERAVLVDAWVSRALAPEPVAFRIRPFARVTTARELEVGSLTLAGTPRRLTRLAGKPIELLANPALVEALEAALLELAIVAIPTGKVPVDTSYRGTRIALDGALVAVEAGMCPPPDRAHHAIFGPRLGPSCVTEPAWQRLVAAIDAFEQPPAQLSDRRVAPVEPIGITLGDGSLLDLPRKPRVKLPGEATARDADPDRLAELLAVLAMPAEVVALPARAPLARIVVAADRVQLALVVLPGGLVAREGEPVALAVGEGSTAILTRPGAAFVDRTLWSEEPTTVRALQLGGTRYTRGAVVGEWTREPAGPVEVAALDRLVQLLAVPRATADAAVPATSIPIALSIVPPAGAPSERKLLLGTAPRCAATTSGDRAVVLAPEVCTLVARLLK